jgi:two-component sensor histidine kinase
MQHRSVIVPADLTVSSGLLVHELVTSAFKYIYFMASESRPTST